MARRRWWRLWPTLDSVAAPQVATSPRCTWSWRPACVRRRRRRLDHLAYRHGHQHQRPALPRSLAPCAVAAEAAEAAAVPSAMESLWPGGAGGGCGRHWTRSPRRRWPHHLAAPGHGGQRVCGGADSVCCGGGGRDGSGSCGRMSVKRGGATAGDDSRGRPSAIQARPARARLARHGQRLQARAQVGHPSSSGGAGAKGCGAERRQPC